MMFPEASVVKAETVKAKICRLVGLGYIRLHPADASDSK